MILQALVKHYEKLLEEVKVPKKGWCQAKVSYGINLSKEGEIIGIIFFKREEQRGKKKVEVPISLMVPNMVTRSSGVSANFLCDNSKYLLGIDTNGTNERMQECFEAAKEKHLSILEGVEGEAAEAIRLFFVNWDPRKAEEDELVKNTLGENISSSYIQAKRREWEEYCAQVSEWEIEHYLHRF